MENGNPVLQCKDLLMTVFSLLYPGGPTITCQRDIWGEALLQQCACLRRNVLTVSRGRCMLQKGEERTGKVLWLTRAENHKKYIFGLCPCFLALSSKILWNFLSDKNDRGGFYSKEETLSGPFDSFRMGACHQKGQSRIRSLEFSTPPQISREGRPGNKSITNAQWFNQWCLL